MMRHRDFCRVLAKQMHACGFAPTDTVRNCTGRLRGLAGTHIGPIGGESCAKWPRRAAVGIPLWRSYVWARALMKPTKGVDVARRNSRRLPSRSAVTGRHASKAVRTARKAIRRNAPGLKALADK